MRHLSLFYHLIALAFAALFLPSAAALAQSSSSEELRQLYRDAVQAHKAKEVQRYQELKNQLTDYPLYPYLEYAELRANLANLDRRALAAFHQRYKDTPLPRLLHRHWLAYLAKRKRWNQFVEAYDASVANTALICRYRHALLKTGRQSEAFDDLESLWVVGRSQHDACDPVFAAWLKSPRFTPNFAWQRFWLALGNNNRTLARYTLRFIDDSARRAVMQQALDYQRQPERLSKLNSSQFEQLPTRTRKLALARLSRTNPTAFLEQRQRLALNAPAYEELAEAAVMRLLRSYKDNAHQWADRIDPNFRSLELLEWRIRDALFRENWTDVGRLLDALPASARFNDRWRYWQAVYLDQDEGDQRRRAEQIFSELSRSRSFYGFLAADRLGGSYSLNNHSQPATAEQLNILSNTPGITRAYELFAQQQLIEARREWFYATRDMSQEEQYHLAQLARGWGWYAQAIRGTIAAKKWDDLVLRFPLAFNQQASLLAKKHRIDTTWIMAIIRQESAFMADARSPAGAMGLMQLMPPTAKQTAKSQRLKYRNTAQLHDPDFNMQLGSAYLAQMHRRFDKQRALASAAYNAGPHRVKRWLEHRGHLPVDAWIETIPFDETRHYVQNVLSYALIYSDLLGLPKQFLPSHERHPLRPEE